MPIRDDGFIAVDLSRCVRVGGPAPVCPLTAGLSAAVRPGLGVGGRRRRIISFGGESGTATVEFALVFPVFMFLVLILVQTTLLMVGNQFVHYSAFAAARSAISYIPSDMTERDGWGRNTIKPAQGTPKYDAIRSSAYFAVMPVCGRLEDGELSTEAFVDGLSDYFASYDRDAPKWVETLAADRLQYAAANTDVTVLETVVDGQGVDYLQIDADEAFTFGPRDAITVRVEHRLNLSVPYVRGIFADGEHDDGLGKYALVSAQYTLTNEGVDPDLPELEPDDPLRVPQ